MFFLGAFSHLDRGSVAPPPALGARSAAGGGQRAAHRGGGVSVEGGQRERSARWGKKEVSFFIYFCFFCLIYVYVYPNGFFLVGFVQGK